MVPADGANGQGKGTERIQNLRTCVAKHGKIAHNALEFVGGHLNSAFVLGLWNAQVVCVNVLRKQTATASSKPISARPNKAEQL